MLLAHEEWELTSTEAWRAGGILQLVKSGEQLSMPCKFVLEGQERENERSYLGFGEGWLVAGNYRPGQDPLEELREFIRAWRQDCHPLGGETGDLTLESGLIGYFDYEWGLVWQRSASTTAVPSYFFRVCPVNIIWLPREDRLVLEVYAETEAEVEKFFSAWKTEISQVLTKMRRVPERVREADKEYEESSLSSGAHRSAGTGAGGGIEGGKWQANMSRGAYLENVRRIQEFIRAGDIFQGVFSQRFTRKINCDAWDIYERLRILNPSPYLYYLEGEGQTLVGSSPELLVSTQGRRVMTRPIAGTRPRGSDAEADAANEKGLLGDEKENAEHAMLVDLGRNDIGRVARYGSVKVSQYAEVERFSHVMHLVSTVQGELAEGEDGLSALRAVFPAGTLSGAPKVRAMEILQELEPERRGAYGGALGILRWNGDVDICITIRTLRIAPEGVSVQAGAGIVYDSQPESEYEETVHKAMALMKVVDEVADND